MQVIIQHNFNTGFGDGFFAMTDYLVNANKLKALGFKVNLQFNLSRNLYFKSKSPMDYVDLENFKIFDSIEITTDPLTKTQEKGFSCVFTHGGANPSSHYWDLFVESEFKEYLQENFTVSGYNMLNMLTKNEIPEVFPVLNYEILAKYLEFEIQKKLVDFEAIYFRTQDLDEELDFLELNKSKILEIINSEKNIFICSNSKEFKKFVKSYNKKNVYYWDLPLEDEWGGNHLLHQTIDDAHLHERTIYTLLDMWTLGKAKEIYFFTTWGRYSNFLFYPAINKVKINYL